MNHRHRTSFVPLFVAVGLATACVSSSAGSSNSSRGSRDVITLEDLDQETSGSAYDAIQRLRPRWLQSRGVSSTRTMRPTPPRVYMDNAPLGSLNSLNSISITDVQRMQFMNAGDATTRFGTGHDGGAIMVTTRSGE